MLKCLGEQKRPWYLKSEEWHLFVQHCQVKRPHAVDHKVVAIKDKFAHCVRVSLQLLVLFRIRARQGERVRSASCIRGKRILRGSKVQKLLGETPGLRRWTEAKVVANYSLQIVLGAGPGTFPFGSEGGNSIHVGAGERGLGFWSEINVWTNRVAAAGNYAETEVRMEEHSSQLFRLGLI